MRVSDTSIRLSPKIPHRLSLRVTVEPACSPRRRRFRHVQRAVLRPKDNRCTYATHGELLLRQTGVSYMRQVESTNASTTLPGDAKHWCKCHTWRRFHDEAHVCTHAKQDSVAWQGRGKSGARENRAAKLCRHLLNAFLHPFAVHLQNDVRRAQFTTFCCCTTRLEAANDLQFIRTQTRAACEKVQARRQREATSVLT